VERSPNILFLMTDEHRYDVAGFAGNTIVRTPTLDRLAADGVVFNNAYTPAPICVPGRQSMMAGQLPRTTGCLRFGQDLPPGHLTFARLFARHGYATVCAGKLHHQGIDQMQGWTHRIGADTILAPEFVENPAPEFAERAFNLKRLKWSDAKEVRRAGIGRSPWAAKDELALAGALDFIEEYFSDPYYDRATPERPLLLKISLNQPHYPYLAPKELFTYYLNRVEPFLDEPVFDHPFLSTRQVRPGVDASERDIRRATAAYYAMVENADAMFGRVIEALEHHGQSIDDWIVVYTSDHGEMLGQHGVWEKQKFFEGEREGSAHYSLAAPLRTRSRRCERQPVRPVRHVVRARRSGRATRPGQPEHGPADARRHHGVVRRVGLPLRADEPDDQTGELEVPVLRRGHA